MVGCGLIGGRRARIAVEEGDTVAVVADVDPDRARELADDLGCRAVGDWREALVADVDAVVVATVNKELAPVGIAALSAGKHVLCEKPLGRNSEEAKALLDAAQASGRVLKTGFNHRHHPAVSQAHELAAAGEIGTLMGIRAAYGHGGRPGYEQEWRADPDLAGGGELLDQGVHVVDLCRWFLGEIAEVTGMTGTWFWEIAPLEDNAFALLRARSGAMATLHTSWTQWHNLFRFEVFGRDGYLLIDGLGGSYGEERLRVGRRASGGGVPAEDEFRFPGEDVSWLLEWREFSAAIAEEREPLGSGEDGYRASLVLDAVYDSARRRAVVEL